MGGGSKIHWDAPVHQALWETLPHVNRLFSKCHFNTCDNYALGKLLDFSKSLGKLLDFSKSQSQEMQKPGIKSNVEDKRIMKQNQSRI